MKDERFPVYDIYQSTTPSVFEKEIYLPLEQLQEYMEIQGKYNAMQSVIEELYNERR